MKRSFTILFLLTCVFVLFATNASAQLLVEDFNYTTGDSLDVIHNWGVQSAPSYVNVVKVASPGLTFSKYVSSGIGNSVLVDTTGQDVYKRFQGDSVGTVYLSFMLNVTKATATGDYFVALSPSWSLTNYYARTFIKASGAGFVFGMSKSNETAFFDTTVFSFNTTYLAVVKYTFVKADSDIINVYVLPNGSSVASEPTTPLITYQDKSKVDAASFGAVTLRQGTAANAPRLFVDGLRVGTSWANTIYGTTIAEVRKDLNSDLIADHSVTLDTLLINGVVTSTNLQSLGSKTAIFIQDSTAGVEVFGYALPPMTTVVGDSVFAWGTVAQYRGAVEFVPLVMDTLHFGIIKHNAVVPTPRHLTLHQYVTNAESYEGLLVEIDSLYKTSGTWPGVGSGGSIYVRNSSRTDTAQLYISSSTNLAGSVEKSYPINVVAIINQYSSAATVYNNGYEIEPSDTSNIIHTPGTVPTSIISGKQGIPQAFELSNNYPNPFNPSTTISFGLPSQSHVTVKVYSILGQEVATLMDGVQEAGYHNAVWNGHNNSGVQAASGVYLLRVMAQSTSGNSSFTQVRKMLLLK